MAKKNRLVAIDYDRLSDELKSKYNDYREVFSREGIYDLREKARSLSIPSVTTFKKNELVDKMVEAMMSCHIKKDDPENIALKMREALCNPPAGSKNFNGRSFEGYLYLDSIDGHVVAEDNTAPKLFVPQGIINDKNLKNGMKLQVKACEVFDDHWGVYEVKYETAALGQFDKFIPIRSDNTIMLTRGYVNWGGRIVVRVITLAEIQSIKEKTPDFRVIVLFLDALPENVFSICHNLKSGRFYRICDNSVGSQEKYALWVLDICKRYVEAGENVLFFIRNLDTLGADVKRKLFGSGRCFKRGSLTVVAETKDPVLVKLATDKIQ